MTAKPAWSSVLTSTPRISAPICGPSRRTSIIDAPARAAPGAGSQRSPRCRRRAGGPSCRAPGARLREPLDVPRRGAACEPPPHEAQGVVVARELEVAHHHGLLVQLPLGVAATDAVHLTLHRLEV